MLKNSKHVKPFRDPTRVLKQPQTTEIPKQIKTLKQQVRASISQVLDFGNENIKSENLIKYSLDTHLNRSQLLEIWNENILSEVKKFIFKVNTIAKLNKNSNMDKLRKDVSQKIEKCSILISNTISAIAEEEGWCFCNRAKCSVKYDKEFTKKKMKNYLLAHLELGKTNQNGDVKKIEDQNPVFFNIKEDPQCEIISLERIEEKKKTEKSIVQFLFDMKINDKERQNCNVDCEWIKSLKQRRKLEKF